MKHILLQTWIAFAIAVISWNLHIYYMPFVNGHWLFKSQPDSIRILMVADPQLQGDDFVKAKRTGMIDLLLNDVYLHHVYQQSRRALQPSHVVFLGDLFSSQNLKDEEFDRRLKRWNWIYGTSDHSSPRIVHLPGNHDIGYGLDMTVDKVSRFEKAFGKSNFYEENEAVGVRLIYLNAMNIDDSTDLQLQNDTWTFVDSIPRSDAVMRNILFLHVPLHKPEDYCSDGPDVAHVNGTVKWQNMISKRNTDYILDRIRPVFVFNGHDHEGCRVVHYRMGDTYRVKPGLNGLMEKGDGFSVMTSAEFDEYYHFEATIRSNMAEYNGYVAQLEIRRWKGETQLAFKSQAFVWHYTIYALIAVDIVFALATIAVFLIVNCARM
eukprot:Partr_v1_DN25992_c0_g1_i1_m68601 putative Metallophosphoesterase 1